MKIAYFLDNQEHLGGAGNLLLQYARLMSNYHDIIVIIPVNEDGSKNEEYVSRCETYGIKYSFLPYRTAYNFEVVDIIRASEQYHCISDFLKKELIELVHYVQLNATVELAARENGIPTLMSVFQLKNEEFKLKCGDLFSKYHLCDSNRYSRAWEKYAGVVSECIRPISPIDDFLVNTEEEFEQLTFLVLGRVCTRKNQLAALKIIGKLNKEYPVKLIIAGELIEAYSEECQDYVRNNNLTDIVEFRDFVSDIDGLMAESDCLLSCSLDESFPTSIVEAVSYGLDIVTTPAGGISEVFHNKENAFVSDGFSDDDIEKNIREYIKCYKKGLLSGIRAAAHQTWCDNFSKTVIYKKLDGYYREVLAGEREYSIDVKTIDAVKIFYDRFLSVNNELSFFKDRILYFYIFFSEFTAKKVYIWGAGKYGKYALECVTKLFSNVNVIAFLDANKTGKYLDHNIVDPRSADYSSVDGIIVAYAGDATETIDFLEKQGFSLHESIMLFR